MIHVASPIHRLLAVFLLTLQVACGALDLASLENVEAQVQVVANKAAPSVVALSHGMKAGLAMGSGVIVSPNGLILTAAHVVSDKKSVDVIFPDGKRVHAKVLGANYDRDVALALITEPGSYPFAELGDTKNLAVGDMVVALGHPGGFDSQRKPPVRFGRVFGFDHDRYIRSDCALASGDSGGPLLDLSGKVVGVHSSVGFDMSVNNDAPIEVVRRDWQRLMKGERWGTNPLSAPPTVSKRELAGMNLDRFRERVIAEGTKNKGWVAATPKTIAQWLAECGMRKDRVKGMNNEALMAFMRKALGGVGEVSWLQDSPEKSARSKASNSEYGGLDVEKFRDHVRSVVEKEGPTAIREDTLIRWLRDFGMSEKRLRDSGPQQLAQLLQTLVNSALEPTADETTIITQDQAVVAAIKPGLDKITPSVVRLVKDRKTLSLGTVVREDGFILTKYSEVAKAKDKLHARVSDGRTLPAVVVHHFADHDLALVKIDAASLPAITIPESVKVLNPGNLLFTPAARTGDPMLAMGVVSVANRSLKESGGYLGVSLDEKNGSIEVNGLVPNGPAASAGLQSKDRIVSVDNLAFQQVDALTKHLRSLDPNTKVQVTYRRGRQESTVEVTLGDRAQLPKRIANTDPGTILGTEVSQRRTGYPVIFQHDQPLNPEDCGGVILDLRGEVVGVNIARAGRVDTYAIPADVVARLLKTLDFDTLGRKPAGGG